MIINNLEILGSGGSFGPFEANPPLVVDADAVLALAITLERFEAVAWQRGKILKSDSRIQAVDLQPCRPGDAGKSLDHFSGGKSLSFACRDS